jgi:hypothetical protein
MVEVRSTHGETRNESYIKMIFGNPEGQTQLRGSIHQWYSTGGKHTPGGTRRQLRGYVKFKISIYILFHE